MRLYLEAMEIVVVEDVEAEFIRADVTSFTDSEIDNVKRAIAEIMAGKEYSLRLHHCYHDEGKSCEAFEVPKG